jgi:hypothetical protein
MLAMAWGLGGVVLFLATAVARLWPRAAEALGMELGLVHWAFVVPWALFMAYSEGHKGFTKSFSPRVVARTWALGRSPRPLHVRLAPAFCMGFFHGTRKRLLLSWILTAFIVVLILGVRLLAQPWRGLVDLGVVVGLSWGTVSLVVLGAQAARQGGTDVDPQLPIGA